jgi:Ca-activated chloride channel family protein
MYDSYDFLSYNNHGGYEPQPFKIFIILVIGTFLYLALAFGFSEARASETHDKGLLFKTLEKGKFLPAPLLGTNVDINVYGIVARVRIRQFYMNPTDKWLEGVYVFPMADKSAVDTLRLKIGKLIVEGEIKERGHARRIYQAAKAEGKKAALLESERPNVFTVSVTNIGPKEGFVVEMAYQEAVTFKNGEFRLRFPMVVGPRYTPRKHGKVTLSGVENDESLEAWHSAAVVPPEAGAINPVNVTVRLGGNWPVSEVKNPHHLVIVENDKSSNVVVKLARGPVPADQDFELTWPAQDAVAAPILFTEEWKGEKFGLVMISPPGSKHFAMPRLRRELIFVIDTSGSMAGESIRQAKASLLEPLRNFNRPMILILLDSII